MTMASMVMARVIIVIVMIAVIIVFVVVVVIVVIVVIVVVLMFIDVVVVVVMFIDVNLAVEVLRFSPNQRRSNSSLNGQTATRTQTPLEHSTEQTIKRIMLGFVVEILFETSMPLESHHRGELKFSSLRDIFTATMGTVGKRWPGLNQWQKK